MKLILARKFGIGINMRFFGKEKVFESFNIEMHMCMCNADSRRTCAIDNEWINAHSLFPFPTLK